MSIFTKLSSEDDLKKIIKTAFDTELPINGAWGYTQSLATIILPSDIPITQLEHMFASMRAYVEMNMTQNEENRYASINLNEISREEKNLGNEIYHKVHYEITAIKESLYRAFIKEYKYNYGQEEFDLNAHFKKRKESTLHREVIHWFKLNESL